VPQLVHDSCWTFSLNFPASQSRHGEPDGECLPVGHMIMQDAVPCSEDFPASQSKQRSTKDPAEDMYVPTSQEVQTEAPAGDVFPEGQSVHDIAPVDSLNFPTVQLGRGEKLKRICVTLKPT
jgi:hypothetical protein